MATDDGIGKMCAILLLLYVAPFMLGESYEYLKKNPEVFMSKKRGSSIKVSRSFFSESVLVKYGTPWGFSAGVDYEMDGTIDSVKYIGGCMRVGYVSHLCSPNDPRWRELQEKYDKYLEVER
jgi:hypothetical protein